MIVTCLVSLKDTQLAIPNYKLDEILGEEPDPGQGILGLNPDEN
jgi:hypothetical protein